MEKVIFLSPHLDDAVFSCAGLIYKLVQESQAVEIITLFSQSTFSHEALYVTRQKEDKQAANALGAHIQHLNFLDAPFRSERPKLLFQSLGSEKKTIESVVTKLKEIFSENSSAQYFVPLGVGWHIDHLITFEAALRSIPRDRLYFYEDAPYSLIKQQTQMRLKGLDHALIEEFSKSFFQSSYAKTFLADWNQEILFNEISTYPELRVPVCIELYTEYIFEGESLKKILTAKKKYRSQSVFYDQVNENFLKERYFRIVT